MRTNDVDPAAPPNEKRCTAHVFVPATSPIMTGLIQSLNPGHPLRLSNSHRDPPAIIFDAVYAGAIVHHFGSQIMKDVVSSAWKNKIHKGGVMSSAGAELKKIVDKRAALAVKTQYEVDKRAERFKRSEVRKSRTLLDTTPSGPDSLDMVMMLPYAFLAENERQAFFMRAREKAEAAEKERLQETVGQWARHVEAST